MSTIAKDQTQINEKIRAKELRLIGQDGEQIGVKSKREALEMAERVDLDLVVVAPNAKPPVARIMDYGKYKFEQQKKEKVKEQLREYALEQQEHEKMMNLVRYIFLLASVPTPVKTMLESFKTVMIVLQQYMIMV